MGFASFGTPPLRREKPRNSPAQTIGNLQAFRMEARNSVARAPGGPGVRAVSAIWNFAFRTSSPLDCSLGFCLRSREGEMHFTPIGLQAASAAPGGPGSVGGCTIMRDLDRKPDAH